MSRTTAGSAKMNCALRRSVARRRLLAALGLLLTCGCASESTRLALDVQRRADEV